jgi:hypothetical protein
MFGVLPRSRNIETADTIAFKIDTPATSVQKRLSNDVRIRPFQKDNSRWFAFLLSSDADLHGAMEWLSMCYEAAGKRNKSR